MNLEDLSKSQLLLLTVLVNFVTSIAVGVLTVSLLDQAPPTVTQTVNRIVDHTVETIASSSPIIIAPPKETTVIVHDEDLLTAAIAADAARTVKIYGNSTSTPAIAIGAYMPKSRAVATMSIAVLPKQALIVFPDGTAIPASLSKSGATLSIYGFSDSATLPTVATPLLVAEKDLKEGQTVIGVTGDGAAVIGIVSRVGTDGIHTSLTGVPMGAAVVNSSGNIIGISLDGATGLIATADRITTLLTATSSPGSP